MKKAKASYPSRRAATRPPGGVRQRHLTTDDRVVSLQPKQYTLAHDGREIVIQNDTTGAQVTGKIRIKAVVCGKPTCRKCPHKAYAYVRYSMYGKWHEKYLGVVR